MNERTTKNTVENKDHAESARHRASYFIILGAIIRIFPHCSHEICILLFRPVSFSHLKMCMKYECVLDFLILLVCSSRSLTRCHTKLSLLFHPVVLFIVWFYFPSIQCVIHEWLHFFCLCCSCIH